MPYEDNDLGVLESLNMRRLSFRQMGSGIEEAAVDTEESSVADRSEATEGAAIPATYSIDNSREGDAVDASADTVRTQRGDVTGSLSTPCDDVSYQAAGETTTDVSSQNDLPVSPRESKRSSSNRFHELKCISRLSTSHMLSGSRKPGGVRRDNHVPRSRHRLRSSQPYLASWQGQRGSQ